MNLLLEYYLDYLNENKWKALLKTGKLGSNSLRKIQKFKPGSDKLYSKLLQKMPDEDYVKYLLKKGDDQKATRYLTKKGIVKSARAWLAGVEKGSKNMLDKMGTKVIHKPNQMYMKQMGGEEFIGKTITDPAMSHGMVSPGGHKSTIHLATGLKKKDQGLGTIIKRHETDEVRSGKKIMNKYSRKQQAGALSDAGHMSDEVLRKEKELTDISNSLYGKKTGVNQLTDLRKQSGEYLNLGSKKEIAKSDKQKLLALDKQMKDALSKLKTMTPSEKEIDYKGSLDQLNDMKDAIGKKLYILMLKKLNRLYGKG